MKAANTSEHANAGLEPDCEDVEFYDPYRSVFEFRPSRPGSRLRFEESHARRKDDLFKDRRFES